MIAYSPFPPADSPFTIGFPHKGPYGRSRSCSLPAFDQITQRVHETNLCARRSLARKRSPLWLIITRFSSIYSASLPNSHRETLKPDVLIHLLKGGWNLWYYQQSLWYYPMSRLGFHMKINYQWIIGRLFVKIRYRLPFTYSSRLFSFLTRRKPLVAVFTLHDTTEYIDHIPFWQAKWFPVKESEATICETLDRQKRYRPTTSQSLWLHYANSLPRLSPAYILPQNTQHWRY